MSLEIRFVEDQLESCSTKLPCYIKVILQIVCAGEWKSKPVNGVPERVLAITVYKLMLKIFGHKMILAKIVTDSRKKYS